MCVLPPPLLVRLRRFAYGVLFVAVIANAQSINISDFYYRDYLDFGQGKGAFSGNGSTTLTAKNGKTLTIPNSPNFSASSNYGSLTSIGRGFAVTANHVQSPDSAEGLLNWGLTKYEITKQSVQTSEGDISGTSKQYGYDEKFLRLDKYVVEGQVEMLDIENSSTKNNMQEDKNKENINSFKEKLADFKDGEGNIYIYQTGSGIVTLRSANDKDKTTFNTGGSGEMRGGGFGTLGINSIEYGCENYQSCGNVGMYFYYYPHTGTLPEPSFNNRITSGDSGSGIYAYDSKKKEWILVGVTSKEWSGQNRAFVSLVSNKDFVDYQQNFEQKINLKINDNQINTWTLSGSGNNATLKYEPRGDSPQEDKTLQGNKDIIFSGGGTIKVENDIDRTVSGYAGGFIFESATSSTTYKFTNEQGKNYFFKGSGLDIGENVEVEWALTTQKGDSLHKIGKGTLTITGGTSEGTLKLGEGKVVLDSSSKAFSGIYITSGRGELALVNGKAEALGATKNITRGDSPQANADSYTLEQKTNNEMGFYFGTGGGTLDLGGNSLTLNTIAANDSGAIITNSSTNAKSTLTIEGFGYDSNGNKSANKADTIIHASIGDISPSLAEGDKGGGSSTQNSTNGNPANIDIIYKGEKNTTQNANVDSTLPLTPSASEGESLESFSAGNGESLESPSVREGESQGATLIFDGYINTSGKLESSNANIALQGHATAHATISDSAIRDKIASAENGTQKGMPEYMDLSKPSTLNQPDWDTRYFKFSNGITLTSANLTLGRNAYLESNINADSSSSITFGGSVKHFIDNKDGANINGSGFGYYQKVESGELSAEMQKLANQTIHYKGKITADGGTIQSHIWDFNASLDLKNNAKLNAEYLTLTNSDSVTLASGANATIQNLVLKNVSDLNGKFSVSGDNSAFKVEKSFQFDNSNFDLTKLDSINGLTKSNYYDIVGFGSSTITGANKDVSANVELYQGASLSLKSLTLKNTSTDSSDSSAIKNTLYLQGDSNQTSNTKLTLSGDLKVENFDENIKAQIQLDGKSELTAQNIEFSSVKDGILALDKDATLTLNSGNGAVKATNSKLNIYLNGDKTFNLNASGTSSVIFGRFDADSTANFSGKITASDSSVVTTALDSITASVDLSGSASLSANKITLDSTHNSINLNGTSMLTAGTITAKNLTNLTLNVADSANANVSNFIFDGGTTNLSGNLIGTHIELKNASVVKAGDLEFKKGATLSLDSTSKLEANNLKVDSTNLTLNLADSTTNAQNLQKITLSNNANLNINEWNFKNATNFTSENSGGRVIFGSATYDAQNGKAQTIGTDSMISGALSLSNVGKAQTSQNTDSTNQSKLTFATLEFSSNLTFGENAKIEVKFSDSVKKENITLREYYTLLSADSIFGNRVNERMKFKFCESCETLFVVSKFDETGKNLQIKFLESAPNTFNELNEALADYKNSTRYSEILKALTEHNQNDDAIDIATRTDDYSVLDRRIKAIDGAMNEIAQGNKTRQTRNLLFTNDHTINTRIAQVRLAQRSEKHLRFAQNDALYRIQTLTQGEMRSDAMPSYANKDNLPNSVWLNVGGGYFGGDSKMGFGATNIGYDRLIDADNGEILLGAMLGFGGSKAQTGGTTDGAMFYNIGLYLHSIFDSQGGKLGGHEIQGNLNFNINDNNKTIDNGGFDSQSAKNTAFGSLISVYYKYNFIVAQNNEISHALKPIVLLALGYNRNGAFKSADYKQEAFGSVNLSYGFGVEYNVVQSESFYSLALTLKDMAYSGGERVFVSLSGAQNFIGYTLQSAPRFSAEINLIGSHKLTDALYLQYGIAGMVDSGANYGAKGDIKLGYKF